MAKAFKQDPPALKKKEEKLGRDLDGDREKGESPAHRAKVLGGKGKGQKEIPSGGLKAKKGAKACKVCKGSHVPPHPHFK